MTKIATFDVSAFVARREASTSAARGRPSADFGQAFQLAETHQETRTPSGQEPDDQAKAFTADDAPAAKERSDDAPVAQPEDQLADNIQDRIDQARVAKAQDAKAQAADARADRDRAAQAADDKAQDRIAKAQDAADQNQDRIAKAQDAVDQAQDAKDQAAQDPTAQAPADPAAQDPQAQAPVDPQAALALMLATANQVTPAQPVAQAPQAVPAVAEQAQAAQQAQIQALPAQDAAAQQQAQAQTQAQPAAQAPAQAQQQAPAQPQVPDLLAQAAGQLGPIKVTVTKQAAPANLAVKLIDEAQQNATTEGPIALATKLDGADGTGTASQPVDLLPQLDADRPDEAPLSDLTADLDTPTPQVNPEPKAELAKASEQKGEASAAPHEVIKQILDRADQIKGAQQNAVKLQLYPEHLGKMEIRVMAHQGVISAQISADTPQAKSMLDGQLASLQRSFAEMGLKVDKVEVTLSSANLDFNGGNAGFAGFDQQQGQQQREPQQQAMRQGSGLGYEQWLPDAPAEDGYVVTAADTGINYVA